VPVPASDASQDLEDLRDLQAAIAENGDKPLIPWEKAKLELDLD
jgi:hypothetical protein